MARRWCSMASNTTLTGVGPFLHVHPEDRPKEIFGGTCTLHFAPSQPCYLLLPIIPASACATEE